MTPEQQWNADKEKLAAGALAGLLVWTLNRGDAGLGITPEVSANITTVVGLVLGYFHRITAAVNDLFVAVINRLRGEVEESCAVPTMTAGSTPGSVLVTVPQPSTSVEIKQGAPAHEPPAPSTVSQPLPAFPAASPSKEDQPKGPTP